jgi:YfiH family protein
MLVEKEDGLLVYRFENLCGFPEIRHGIFSRKGGFSSGPFESLNVSLGVGDEPEHVRRNRDLISESLESADLLYLRQVHSDKVHLLGAGSNPQIFKRRQSAPQGDAMITNLPGNDLLVQTADCQTVMLYDPVRRVAANIHSGWRGSVQNVVGKTAAAMKKVFGVKPENVYAGIGPSLGPCCAEFVNYKKEIPEDLWRYRNKDDFFDFWSMTQEQLAGEGVPFENLENSGICTSCSTEIFFSYRKEKVTGRFAGIIGIR